jgi:hypothetical protein
MSINLALADAYFSAHVNGRVWADFQEEDRGRAVTHALRIISARGRNNFRDTTTADGDSPRWDVAVYEQALHMLRNSNLPRDGQTGAPRYLEEQAGPPSEFNPERLCDAAIRWITGNRGWPPVEMRRG